jgi:hypothetical protein
MFLFPISLVLALFLSCASGSKTALQTPQEGKSLLVGAILLENNGVEDVYEAKTAKITVILVGKSISNEKEKTEGYRVKTDENGYFMLQNVAPGAYVLKGIEADIGYETRLMLTSRWEGNEVIYYPVDTYIDYTVRVWPESRDDQIIDLGIHYFSIDAAFRTFHKQYPQLNNTALALKDKIHTQKNPTDYFREKHPDWEWFKK